MGALSKAGGVNGMRRKRQETASTCLHKSGKDPRAMGWSPQATTTGRASSGALWTGLDLSQGPGAGGGAQCRRLCSHPGSAGGGEHDVGFWFRTLHLQAGFLLGPLLERARQPHPALASLLPFPQAPKIQYCDTPLNPCTCQLRKKPHTPKPQALS